MLVKCVKNKVEDVKGDPLLEKCLRDEIHLAGDPLPIIIGRNYVVYAIVFEDTLYPKFYICDETYDGQMVNYPAPYYSCFFDIVDARLSRYWNFGYHFVQFCNRTCQNISIFTFKQWAEDHSYFERLINSSLEENALFKKYKKLFDEEQQIQITD